MRCQVVEVRTGDPELDRLLTLIRTSRLAARMLGEQVAEWTRLALTHPAMPKTDRDAAAALGLSFQRVGQLRHHPGIGTARESADRAGRG